MENKSFHQSTQKNCNRIVYFFLFVFSIFHDVFSIQHLSVELRIVTVKANEQSQFFPIIIIIIIMHRKNIVIQQHQQHSHHPIYLNNIISTNINQQQRHVCLDRFSLWFNIKMIYLFRFFITRNRWDNQSIKTTITIFILYIYNRTIFICTIIIFLYFSLVLLFLFHLFFFISPSVIHRIRTISIIFMLWFFFCVQLYVFLLFFFKLNEEKEIYIYIRTYITRYHFCLLINSSVCRR